MLWFISSLAWAENAVDIEVVRHGQINTSNPSLIVKVRQPLSMLDVRFSCGGKSNTLQQSAERGDIAMPISVVPGTHNCKGTLSIEMDDGSSGTMPLNFQITMHPALTMTIPENMVDVESGKLSVKMDRPAETYAITLLDSSNSEVGQGFERVDPAFNLGLTEVTWEAISDDIAVIQVDGLDVYGFTTQTRPLVTTYPMKM